MKYKQYKVPVVQLASGDSLSIKVHHFVAEKPGKKIYLQANIHGPEIVGIGVLLKLVNLLKKKPVQNGEIKIVISANPVGLNEKISGYQVGYKNLNGTKYANWNKIFKEKINKSDTNYCLHLEDKLAKLLQTESTCFDVAVDLHSAQNNTEIAYCFSNSKQLAKNIGVQHVVILENKFTGCFDEAFLLGNKSMTHPITLELSGKFFDEGYLDQWSQKLYSWVVDPLDDQNPKQSNSTLFWPKKADKKYYSSYSGLLVTSKNPGDKYKTGETLAKLMSLSGKVHKIKASQNGYIFKIPLTQIVGEGEEILEALEGAQV